MDTVAHLALIAGAGSLIAGVVIGLFSRSSRGTQARNVLFCLVVLSAGVYRVADSLALRQKGLGTTFGRHSSIIHMRERPVEAALTFWFSVLIGGAVFVCGLVGAVAFMLPEREQNAADAQAAQNTDAAESAAEEAVP